MTIAGHYKHSEETKKKLSAIKQGIFRSEETKQKISLANKGKQRSKESKIKMSITRKGCNNANWRGGTSFLPYCPKFNFQKREEIREKYGRKCFLCELPESKNKGRRLCVHHINYDKEQGCNGKTFELVPLCIKCHGKTGGKREYWSIKIYEAEKLIEQ